MISKKINNDSNSIVKISSFIWSYIAKQTSKHHYSDDIIIKSIANVMTYALGITTISDESFKQIVNKIETEYKKLQLDFIKHKETMH